MIQPENTAQPVNVVAQYATMNKRELSKAVAVHSDVDVKTVSNVLEGFTDVVTAVVAQGERVVITGFAKFVKVNRAARMGRNPATGEAIHIKASKKARITPVKAFKDAVMQPSTAPRLKRGSFPINEDAVRAAGKVATPARAAKPAGRAKKATAKRRPASRKTTARKTTAKRRPAAKTAPKRRTTARKTTARRTVAKKPAARRTTARKTTAKRRPAAKRTAARRR
jgi:DNA-binding protein HU-beta